MAAFGYYLVDNPIPKPEPLKVKTILSGKLPVPTTTKMSSLEAMVTPANPKPVDVPQPFSGWLGNPKLTFESALTDIYKIWGKDSPPEQRLDCNVIEKNGLNCYFDRSKWQDLIDFNRPAILEFTLTPNVKRYALLTGTRNGQAVFQFGQNKDVVFPLADVLSIWDGYFMLVWQSPVPGMKIILPGQSSEHVLWLRQQLMITDSTNQGGKWTLYFDDTLKNRVITFQQAHRLTADGKVGGQTIIHLDNLTGVKGSPRLSQVK